MRSTLGQEIGETVANRWHPRIQKIDSLTNVLPLCTIISCFFVPGGRHASENNSKSNRRLEKAARGRRWVDTIQSRRQTEVEEVGRKSDAIGFISTAEIRSRAGVKLPSNLRARGSTFSEIATEAEE